MDALASPVLWMLGTVLVVGTTFEALATTLSTIGAGPFSERFMHAQWRVLQLVCRGSPAPSVVNAIGPVMLVSLLGLWMVSLWLGYFCLFSAQPEAIVHAGNGTPVDPATRLYFSGYTVFTLGLGDIVPVSASYRVLTAIAAANGLALVTIGITYSIPVLTAVAARRQLAGLISNMGSTPEEVIRNGWREDGLEELIEALGRLEPLVEMNAQRQRVYPLLFYFHSGRRRENLSIQIAVLHETLFLLRECVAIPSVASSMQLRMLRASVCAYLDILDLRYPEHRRQAPDHPSLELLRDAGIPIADNADSDTIAKDYSKQRRLLLSLLVEKGHTWDEVVRP